MSILFDGVVGETSEVLVGAGLEVGGLDSCVELRVLLEVEFLDHELDVAAGFWLRGELIGPVPLVEEFL